jgi:alkylglycerol monooxygenase
MKVDYIALSIPVFFLLIGIELIIQVVSKKELYSFSDSITNISLGVGQQVTGIFMKTAVFFGYFYLYEHSRIFTIQNSVLNWFLLFLGVDFFYYWFHRLSHEINAMWAAHIVHHQSEEYNLSVALRQSWFQTIFSSVFYLPLALIGFEPIMFLTVASFNTLYQFWIHTRTIGKLGPFEWFMNTPSHHRVHHGSNPKYIDRNHAGTLIIWDRLFGTFQKEEEEPVYGITKPLNSWNPVWANFHYWAELFYLSEKTKSWKEKIKIFFMMPGWQPADLGGFQQPPEIDKQQYKKFYISTSKKLNVYVLIQFAMIVAATTFVLFKQSMISKVQLTIVAAYTVFTIMNLGVLLEKKKWSKTAEYARILLTIVLCFFFFEDDFFKTLLTISVIYSFASLAWFSRIHKSIG